jgi:hypothetical protein
MVFAEGNRVMWLSRSNPGLMKQRKEHEYAEGFGQSTLSLVLGDDPGARRVGAGQASALALRA